MERTPPHRGPSRPGTSGFQRVVAPTAGQRARAAVTPRRLIFAGAAVVMVVVGSFFLDTAFPESIEATGDAEARRAGRALLERMASAAGGLDRLREVGVITARVEDRWAGPFASLTPWSTKEARFELATRVVGPAYHARMSFVDGLTWGYDGDAWIDGGDATATPLRRARLFTRELPRLMLAPFAAVVEDAVAERIAPGIVSVRFRDPGRASVTQEWRFYVDEATAELTAVVLPFSGADPSPLSLCKITRWEVLDGLRLPEGYDCSMANRATIALHQMRFSMYASDPPALNQFALSRVGTSTRSAPPPPAVDGRP